ncbi:MAG: histidinol-phosphatase HisJ family protein [Clostridia bacterium]
MKTDLHVHTNYSPDAKADSTFERNCQCAIDNNIDIICFTDHIDVYGPFETYRNFDFVNRKKDYAKVCKRYEGKMQILFGLEYAEPNTNLELFEKVTKATEYDFILGSVHIPTELYLRGQLNVEQLWQEQYSRTLAMAKVGKFDSLAHLDFPKKFVNKYCYDQTMTEQILKECVKNNISLEINTSTMRKNLPPSPQMEVIELYHKLGGKYVTIGSDSHNVTDIGSNYDDICSTLPKGIVICYYKKRKLIEL